MAKKRNISHKLALLGGSDFWHNNRQYTRYKQDGETILLAYDQIESKAELKAIETELNAMVITAKSWADNMTARWREIRERLLEQISNTVFYTVIFYQNKGYRKEAKIVQSRLDLSARLTKNRGLAFRTVEEAEVLCNFLGCTKTTK